MFKLCIWWAVYISVHISTATGDCSPRMAQRERPPQALLQVDSVVTQLVFSYVWSTAVAVHSASGGAVRGTSPASRFLEMSTGASVDCTVLRTNVVRPWCVCFLGDDRTLVFFLSTALVSDWDTGTSFGISVVEHLVSLASLWRASE